MPRVKIIDYPRFGLLTVVLTVLALLITVVSVFFVVRSEKTEVAALFLSSDELTTYPPEVEGHFTYMGEEVAYLWKVRVKFANSGDKTIVGVGNQKNIFGEGLNFMFPDGTRILRVEEEVDTFDGSIVLTKPNGFQIQFPQWRSGEYVMASFYVASDEPLDVDPSPTVPNRDIIDGEVVIQDLTEKRIGERVFLIDRLPTPISTPGKIIGVITSGLLVIALMAMGISGWKPALRLDKWKKQHILRFSDYLDQLEPALSERDKKVLKEKPYKLTEAFWAKFEGEKVTEAPTLDSRGDCIAFIIISVVMLCGFISLILMLIPA